HLRALLGRQEPAPEQHLFEPAPRGGALADRGLEGGLHDERVLVDDAGEEALVHAERLELGRPPELRGGGHLPEERSRAGVWGPVDRAPSNARNPSANQLDQARSPWSWSCSWSWSRASSSASLSWSCRGLVALRSIAVAPGQDAPAR